MMDGSRGHSEISPGMIGVLLRFGCFPGWAKTEAGS